MSDQSNPLWGEYVQRGNIAAFMTAKILNDGAVNEYYDRINNLLANAQFDSNDKPVYLDAKFIWPTVPLRIYSVENADAVPEGAEVISGWYKPALIVKGPEPACMAIERPSAIKPVVKGLGKIWAFFGGN